jgi:2-polyprenyl-3-methyl-5-hydroxy-6-metoxy-1,4-benzoquinol methylase
MTTVSSGHPQAQSRGSSANEIYDSVLFHAGAVGLSWADIGCGHGKTLRLVKASYAPTRLVGSDLLPWLDEDLFDDVEFIQADAVDAIDRLEPVDRLLMIETIEHLEAPWVALRAAARKLKLDGILIVTTPNLRTLRHRLDMLMRGQLTSFRPDNQPHLTPALPHVTRRILEEEGLQTSVFYSLADVVPLTGGKIWPASVATRFPVLLNASVGVIGHRIT